MATIPNPDNIFRNIAPSVLAATPGKRESVMTSRNDITRRLMLAGAAAAGGLATAAVFLLRRPNAAGDDSNGSGDDSNAGGFTALPEAPQAVYPLVNDALRDLLRRMEHHEPGWDWIEDNVFRSITIRGEQEYPKQVTLTITERGYHDDAVDGVVMRYRLEKSSDGWRITRAEEKQLRWPGY
jgi:hypothetical protein